MRNTAPHHMDLSSGCLSVLPARQLASPRAGSPRVSEEESEMPLMAHFSVVTCCHFCLILFIRSESLSSVTPLPTVVTVVLLLSCSYSLQPHELQHPRLPCSSLSPRVWSCLLSLWCHLTISSSVAHFIWIELNIISRKNSLKSKKDSFETELETSISSQGPKSHWIVMCHKWSH